METYRSDSFCYSVLRPPREDRAWNAFLDLRVHTYLEPYVPSGGQETLEYTKADGSEASVRIVPWDSGPPIGAGRLTWDQFTARFKSELETFWNNRLWLVPSGPWGMYNRTPTASRGGEYPNVRCNLTIVWAGSADTAHLHARCCRLHPQDGFWRSNMASGAGCVGRIRAVVGIRDANLDDLDVFPKHGPGTQKAVVHEMGHYIGLPHSACDSNDDACYGAPGTPEAADIMGRGTQINPWHAERAWRPRLLDHTRGGPSITWTGTTDRPRVHPLPPTYYSPPPRYGRAPGGV